MAQPNMSPQAYSEFVTERFNAAANDPSLIVFTNRGPSHARTVLREITTRSEVSLSIVTGSLSAAVYDGHDLRAAAARITGSVRILITNASPFQDDSALANLDGEIKAGRIQVRLLKPFFDQVKFDGRIRHFAICDDRFMRVEDDIDNHTATIILNPEAKMITPYTEMFDMMWLWCQPFPYLSR